MANTGSGQLIGVIGDEDTVTGFLLAGVGNVDARRKSNFLIVDNSESTHATPTENPTNQHPQKTQQAPRSRRGDLLKTQESVLSQTKRPTHPTPAHSTPLLSHSQPAAPHIHANPVGASTTRNVLKLHKFRRPHISQNSFPRVVSHHRPDLHPLRSLSNPC
jgi:V-type H+-transporting ATPase subunit F